MNENMPNGEYGFGTNNGAGTNSTTGTTTAATGVPAKVSIWTKLKDFLLQDIEKMELVLTPGEKKFVDFWTQEVTIDKAYNFLFQEVKFK